MRRNQDSEADRSLLDVIGREFAVFRQTRRGPRERCSDRLRELALAAVDAGHSVDLVGESAGISTSAIYGWLSERRGKRPPQARQLQIIPDSNPMSQEAHRDNERAIVKVSAISIEVPLTALTAEFVRSLAAVGGG